MEKHLKMNANFYSGANHNSTIRDFFETYAASSSDSAELADRLPDHLFKRSLTSPDEKFSVTRFVYSTPDAEKRFDKKSLPSPQSEIVSKTTNNSTKDKQIKQPDTKSNNANRDESMSETEKQYLYSHLLKQNKNDDHPSILKHRRLMLDFQTRRDIARADDVVLPMSVLHNEGVGGVQGKIVYLQNPMNRIKSPMSNRGFELSKKQQYEKCINRNRPKTAPNITVFRNKPAIVTLKPLTPTLNTSKPSLTRRFKPNVSFTSRGKHIIENRLKIKASNGPVEFDIRNARSLSARSQMDNTDNDNIKEEMNTLNLVGSTNRKSSITSNPSTPGTPRLSLNVFLPREIEEVRLCNLPEPSNLTETSTKNDNLPIYNLSRNDILESTKTAGLVSARYGLSKTTKDLMSKFNQQSLHCPRFQYTQANFSSKSVSGNVDKSVQCDLNGPGQGKVKIGDNLLSSFHNPNRPLSSTLRLGCRRSTFI